MSVSNNSNYNQTRDEIIADALFLIGKLGEGETPSSNSLTFCSSILNKMIKHWETQGIHLWTTSFGTMFVRDGVSKYILSSSGDHACDDDTLIETVLTITGSGTSVTLEDTTGISTSDIIGIALDDNTRQWTTVVSVVGSLVTITDALTGAASSGNTVFSYTTNLGRILKVIKANYRVFSDSDLNMNVVGRDEYFEITTKTSPGSSNILHYMPRRDDGIVYVWPVPNDVSCRVKFSYIRSILDFDSGTDNPDLPQEWLDGLTYNLARRIAPSYGVDLKRKDLSDIIDIANQTYAELKLWDNDNGSVFIVSEEFE